jgi:2,2-dialkylglycine decarboxylase (pyruvate)
MEFTVMTLMPSPAGRLAACLVEPILSSGGIIDLPPGYLATWPH